jgi:hypothetical protein
LIKGIKNLVVAKNQKMEKSIKKIKDLRFFSSTNKSQKQTKIKVKALLSLKPKKIKAATIPSVVFLEKEKY